MSTLRVDNIKSRTTNKVTIPNSHSLEVTGGLTVAGVTTYASGGQLSLQGTDVNAGTRGDVLYYDANGKIAKLNIGSSGSVLKSDGTDVLLKMYNIGYDLGSSSIKGSIVDSNSGKEILRASIS